MNRMSCKQLRRLANRMDTGSMIRCAPGVAGVSIAIITVGPPTGGAAPGLF